MEPLSERMTDALRNTRVFVPVTFIKNLANILSRMPNLEIIFVDSISPEPSCPSLIKACCDPQIIPTPRWPLEQPNAFTFSHPFYSKITHLHIDGLWTAEAKPSKHWSTPTHLHTNSLWKAEHWSPLKDLSNLRYLQLYAEDFPNGELLSKGLADTLVPFLPPDLLVLLVTVSASVGKEHGTDSAVQNRVRDHRVVLGAYLTITYDVNDPPFAASVIPLARFEERSVWLGTFSQIQYGTFQKTFWVRATEIVEGRRSRASQR